MANLIVSAVSTFDNKGLKKGKKEISTFEKQVKSFAKVFATAFSVRALTNYSKKAVQAFAADEKAAKSLEIQLKNTGYQFSAPGVELYIANLQKTTGVLDDQLRPAFQQLLTVTGSINTSQDALNTALNVSAATGKSLTTVTTALARAYAGNTTGLSRLGAGLDKALLASGDMNKIMGELNKKFAGQSAARLTTYAGKMDLLAVAAADAQEIIGKGILDALTLLSDDNTIDNLTTGMEDFATAISEVIVGLGKVGSELKDLGNLPGGGSIFDVRNIPVIGAYIGGLRQIGRSAMPQQDRGGQERTASRIYVQQVKQEKRVADGLAKARAEELRLLGLKNAIDNKNVAELQKKFDIERIGITAALNSATDSETKLRLQAQLAILDNNEAMAKKLLAEIEASEALKKLAEQARLAGMSLEDFAIFKVKTLSTKIDDYVQNMVLDLIRQLNARIASYLSGFNVSSGGKAAIGGGGNITYDVALASVRAQNSKIQQFLDNINMTTGGSLSSNLTGSSMGGVFSPADFRRGEEASMQDIRITVDTAQTGDRFAQLVAESIQVATKTGISYGVAGGL